MLVPVLRLAARLPLAWLHCAGAALGWLAYWFSPTYAAHLRENLYASGICCDRKARRALLRRAIAESGKGVTELIAVWFAADERVKAWVACENWDVVEAAQRTGRGIIFLTPHLGCFEISALFGAQRLPITVMYRPPKMEWLEPLMLAGRQRWRAKVAPANMKGVRMLYKALQRGDAVGLLPDQTPGSGEGAWSNFFGRPAYTMTLVGRLKRATGAEVIMAFAERLSAGRGYRLHLHAVHSAELDETALNREIEALVRRCPAQYLWGYNRYKVPAGAAPPPASMAGASGQLRH